jgi:hypothetical protein
MELKINDTEVPLYLLGVGINKDCGAGEAAFIMT